MLPNRPTRRPALAAFAALAALSLATALSGCNDDDGPRAIMGVSVVDDEGQGTGTCFLQFSREDTGGGCGQGFREGAINIRYKIIADGIARITVSGQARLSDPESELVERIYEESFAIERKVEETGFTLDGRAMRLKVEGLGRAADDD